MIRATLFALLLLAGTASAQQPDSPATTGYKKAMEGMMTGMDHPYSGNADRDFVTGMLPHHQGAVDMARVELQYGSDPELRKLAREIINSQTKEQIFMRQWLAQHKAP